MIKEKLCFVTIPYNSSCRFFLYYLIIRDIFYGNFTDNFFILFNPAVYLLSIELLKFLTVILLYSCINIDTILIYYLIHTFVVNSGIEQKKYIVKINSESLQKMC